MALSEKSLIAILAGLGGAAALLYLLRTQKQESRRSSTPARNTPSLEATVETPVERILEIQSKLGLSPNPQHIRELSELLQSVSEEDLGVIKANSDILSFLMSEWIFYHTLRTKKVHYDSVTGVMDGTLSPQEKDLGKRIALTMRRAYWDKHLEDLKKSPPNYGHVLDRLGELQSRINMYQKSRKSEIFDLDLIKQAVLAGAFDRPFFASLVERVIQALADLESPASHEETRRWFNEREKNSDFHSDIVSCLEFLFSQLDVLEAEIAAFKSNQISMEIRRKKERETFSTLIKNERLKIPILKSHFGSVTTNQEIIHQFKLALLGTLFKSDAMLESLIPDSEFLDSIRARIQTDIVDRACNLVGVHSQIASLAQTKILMQQSTDFLSTVPPAELVDEVIARLSVIAPLNEVQIDSISSGIKQCCSDTSQVRRLYTKRAESIIEKGLSEASAIVESNAFGSSPWYLSICAKNTSSVLSELIEFMAEHLHVYLPIYRDIL